MVKAISAQDGPRLTVADLVKDPTAIPKRILQDINKFFIIGDLLRTLPGTSSGAYIYDESTPLYANGDAAIVEEFGEIPTISGEVGQRRVAVTVKRALALLVSQEMIDRNDMDRVNTQIKQIRNTMVRTWNNVFFLSLLNHPDVPSINATAAWNAATTYFAKDVMTAQSTIEDAAPANLTNQYFDFEPDTIVIGRNTRTDLIQSDSFNKVYKDALSGQAPQYTGTLPGSWYGMNIMVSRQMDLLAPGKALVLQRKVVGGIGDERALSSTPLRRLDDNETYRTNTVRRSAVVLDQPKAACWINGVR